MFSPVPGKFSKIAFGLIHLIGLTCSSLISDPADDLNLI